MITKNDFEKGMSFKLRHDTGKFIYNYDDHEIIYKKEGKGKTLHPVIGIGSEGFHVANPFAEGVFIYYEFKQFDLCKTI